MCVRTFLEKQKATLKFDFSLRVVPVRTLVKNDQDHLFVLKSVLLFKEIGIFKTQDVNL